MSHHLSGPGLRPPEDDPRLDMTDLFAFQSPRYSASTVLILNVNSFDLAPGAGPELHPDAVYQISVDNDGDLRADVTFSFVFAPPSQGAQTVSVYYATGEDARRYDAAGRRLIADAPVGFDDEPRVVEADWLTFAVGMRSDPFFADVDGFLNHFQWTGKDTMADKNIMSIALEMPGDRLGERSEIGVWGRVSVRRDGAMVSVDRGAHPSVTAFFNSEETKDAYNRGEPADDRADFMPAWIGVLQHTGGYTPEEAEKTLQTICPDILHFDRLKPAAYPNGRKLNDDVVDMRVAMITNGAADDDGIGPHTDLMSVFPYLGPPHVRG